MASVAGALLAIDLTAAAAHHAAGQCALGALTLVGKDGADDQMHGGYVGLYGEDLVLELHFANVGALHVQHLNTGHNRLFLLIRL